MSDIKDFAIIKNTLVGIVIQTASLNGLLSQYLAGDLQVDAASLLAFFKTILDRMDVDIKTKLETNEVFLAAINKTMAQYKTFLLKKDVVDNSNEPSPTIH